MKNKIVTIALAALIVFSMTACPSPTSPSGGGGSNGGNSGGSISDMGGINSIAYGNGKFVAGGIAGVIATSTDGVTWKTIANESNPLYGKNLYAIAFGNGKFVAASSYYGNTLAYSSDGITWTKGEDNEIFYTDPDYYKAPVKIKAIAYGNGTFVAGGEYGKMGYSTNNGATWTAVPNESNPFYVDKYSGNQINAIAYGNGKFVAVGSDKDLIAYSSDGINWTAVTASAFGTSTYFMGVAWGNNTFVAGGLYGKMAYSSDGINWTAVTDSKFSTDLFNQIWSITWGNDRFVAGGSCGEMAYSTDGVNWTATDSKFGKDSMLDQIWGIAWGNNTFVAVGTRGNSTLSGVITTSPDGVTWTAIPIN